MDGVQKGMAPRSASAALQRHTSRYVPLESSASPPSAGATSIENATAATSADSPSPSLSERPQRLAAVKHEEEAKARVDEGFKVEAPVDRVDVSEPVPVPQASASDSSFSSGSGA